MTSPASSRKELRLLPHFTQLLMADGKSLLGQSFLALDAEKIKHLGLITKPMESSGNVQSQCHLQNDGLMTTSVKCIL